jgi:hypothetical protein
LKFLKFRVENDAKLKKLELAERRLAHRLALDQERLELQRERLKIQRLKLEYRKAQQQRKQESEGMSPARRAGMLAAQLQQAREAAAARVAASPLACLRWRSDETATKEVAAGAACEQSVEARVDPASVVTIEMALSA